MARTLGPAAFARSGALAGVLSSRTEAKAWAPSSRTGDLAWAPSRRTEALARAPSRRTGDLTRAPSSRTEALAGASSTGTEILARAPTDRTGTLAGARLKHRAAILLERARLADRARGDLQSEGRVGTLHITLPVSCQIVKKVCFLQGGTQELTVTISRDVQL